MYKAKPCLTLSDSALCNIAEIICSNNSAVSYLRQVRGGFRRAVGVLFMLAIDNS